MPAQKRPFPDSNHSSTNNNNNNSSSNNNNHEEEEEEEQQRSPSRPRSSSLPVQPHHDNGHHPGRRGRDQDAGDGGGDEPKKEEQVKAEDGEEVKADGGDGGEQEGGKEEEGDDEEEKKAKQEKDAEEDSGRSKSSRSSSSSEEEEEEEDEAEGDEKPEFVTVELPEIRKDVQCPICLGIIKKTRTVMECLHRFCRECIDKSMRLGNNECPACRTHCASRRSLRDDPNYDALIAALYPDIDKYEEEELAFHEEERTRNKQIQASIAQIFQRQSEALVKRRSMGKESSPFTTRQRNQRSVHPRRRRNSRGAEFQASEENEEEDDDNGGKDSSSDERSTEVRQRRRKRWPGIRSSLPSSSAANSDALSLENDTETSRENRGLSPGLVWSTEMLAWGRGGARSHTRHGNASSCNKNSRAARLSKLVEYLRSLEEKNDELDVHLILVSLDKQSPPNSQQPYLCCRPTLSIKHLCEYVAHQTPLQAEEIEILLVKGQHSLDDNLSSMHPPISMDELQILKGQETLGGLKASCTSSRDCMILAYRQKDSS